DRRIKAVRALRPSSELQTPVRLAARPAILPFHPVAGGELLNSLDHRVSSGNVVEREIVVEGGKVERAFDPRLLEDGLQFGTKVEVVPLRVNIERLDAQAIARQHQALFRWNPYGQSEHAAQPRKTFNVPLPKREQHRFGVASGSEAVTVSFEGL